MIITILVMMIIAAAVILYLDDTKVVNNAKKAVNENDIQVAKEIAVVAKTEWRTKGDEIDKDMYPTLQAYVESKLEEAGFQLGYGNGKVFVTEEGLLSYLVIPEGFVLSDLETEDEIEEGLVIYEGTEPVSTDLDAQTTRNQFVWVPVQNMSEFVRRDGYYDEKLETEVSRGYATEPCSWRNTLITETNDLTGEYAEYAKMKESVAKYGGFYIARYETGTSVQRTNTANGTSSDILSQKDKYPYNYVA